MLSKSFPNWYFIVFFVLLFLGGCTPQETVPDTSQYAIEYCQESIREAQLHASSVQRDLGARQRALARLDVELMDAERLRDDEKIREKTQEQAEQERIVKDTHISLEGAEEALQKRVAECDLLAERPDSSLCQQFTLELQDKLHEAEKMAKKDLQDLEDFNALLRISQRSRAASDVLQSIEKDIDYKNLELLKNTNQRDRYEHSMEQLRERCLGL